MYYNRKNDINSKFLVPFSETLRHSKSRVIVVFQNLCDFATLRERRWGAEFSKLLHHRNTLNNYFHLLAEANLVNLLHPKSYSISALQKPAKILMDNTNLLYALAEQSPDAGSVREHFALNQLSVKHQVHHPIEGDFLIDNQMIIEVGGKNKSINKYSGSVILVLDNLEFPVAGKIPLWLLEFLY